MNHKLSSHYNKFEIKPQRSEKDFFFPLVEYNDLIQLGFL